MRFYFTDNDQAWDDFLVSAGPRSSEFLQSFIWGRIMAAKGQSVIRLYGLDDKKNWLVASSLYGCRLAPTISYWYCPRGPFLTAKICHRLDFPKSEAWRLVLSSWYREARRNKITFVRFEPPLLSPEELDLSSDAGQAEIFKAADSLKMRLLKAKPLQPEKTLWLDLSVGREVVLQKMKQKTRYNIRLAIKQGLVASNNPANFPAFWKLLQATSARDGFRLHSYQHYYHLLKKGGSAVKLISIKKGDKVIAAGLFSFFGKKAVYLHGASDYQERSLMAPYLLQWAAIKQAIAQSCRYYDFQGIDEKKWPGVTKFKRGFGGQEIIYPGAFDLIVYPGRYYAYQLGRQLLSRGRRISRFLMKK